MRTYHSIYEERVGPKMDHQSTAATIRKSCVWKTRNRAPKPSGYSLLIIITEFIFYHQLIIFQNRAAERIVPGKASMNFE